MANPQPTPRNQLLRAVYHKWHAAMAEGRPDVTQRIATSGERFNEYWQPFGSRAHHHADFTSWLEKSGRPLLLSPRQQQDRRRPYHIDLELMVKLTTRSCELEGSSMSEQDVSVVGRSIAESGIPTFHLAWDCGGGALPSPPRELRQKLDFRSAVHISEAYFHMLALNLGQGLLLPRDTFNVTEREFLRLHEVLMYPFHDKSPGKYRSLPIQVAGDTARRRPCPPLPPRVRRGPHHRAPSPLRGRQRTHGGACCQAWRWHTGALALHSFSKCRGMCTSVLCTMHNTVATL
jgi:hypothetical protein